MNTYAYTATRVKAMKSNLLKQDDYMKMRKMGLHEMIRSLEEGEYKKEISTLGATHKGVELINIALNENLAAMVSKLIIVSNKKDARDLITLYSSKWIYNNLKLIARKLINNISEEDMKYSIIPIHPMSRDYYTKVVSKEEDSINTISRISGLGRDVVKKHIDNKELSQLENKIDMLYYKDLEEFFENKKSSDIKDFFIKMAELMNIRNIMKLKYYEVSEEEIKKLIIGNPKGTVKKMLSLKYEECVTLLEKDDKEISKGVKENRTALENNIDKILLKRASNLLHKNSLSISPIFGFMIQKEAEVRNIRLLVNTKTTQLDENFVDENIII